MQEDAIGRVGCATIAIAICDGGLKLPSTLSVHRPKLASKRLKVLAGHHELIVAASQNVLMAISEETLARNGDASRKARREALRALRRFESAIEGALAFSEGRLAEGAEKE